MIRISPNSYHENMFDENDVYIGEVPTEEELIVDEEVVQPTETPTEEAPNTDIEGVTSREFQLDPKIISMIAEGNRLREAGKVDSSEASDGMSHVSPRRQDRLSSESDADQDESKDSSETPTKATKKVYPPGYKTQAQRNARAHEAQALRHRRGE